MKKLFVLLVIMSLNSCKSKQEIVEKKMLLCLDESINKNALENEKINFYSLMESYENLLISDDNLENKSKKSYLIFLDNLDREKNLVNRTKAFVDNNKFEVEANALNILNYCINIGFIDDNFENYKNEINFFVDSGYENLDHLKKMIEILDLKKFSNKTYRSFIIYSIISHLIFNK